LDKFLECAPINKDPTFVTDDLNGRIDLLYLDDFGGMLKRRTGALAAQALAAQVLKNLCDNTTKSFFLNTGC